MSTNNSNHLVNPAAREAMDKFKMEAAAEVGVSLKDSHLRGGFTAEAGQKLMFTIPYDEGWTCFIDGKEAEIKQVLGVFMAVDAPEGTHSYEMKFFPVGMKTGIALSAPRC